MPHLRVLDDEALVPVLDPRRHDGPAQIGSRSLLVGDHCMQEQKGTAGSDVQPAVGTIT